MMKNNPYDDESFFANYSEMAGSKYGLNAAGEWYQMERLFPDLEGKTVLDLGCGYGWHSQYVIDQRAVAVTAIDSSERMLAMAKQLHSDERIEYVKDSIESYEPAEGKYDFVISNLVLHYVEDLNEVYKKIYPALKPGGVFVMNIEHPVFTSGIRQEWIKDGEGNIVCWPVDDYFKPGIRNTVFLSTDIQKYHHTLSQILNGLLDNGFVLSAVEEVQPSQAMIDADPSMENELRRPMMLLVKAVRA